MSVCVCSTNLGFSVRSANRIRPKNGIPMPVYIHSFGKHTHAQQRACDNCGQRNGGRSCCLMDRVVNRVVRVTTAASETEGVTAVSWIELLMIRRPLGSIDPNSIHETEHVCIWYQRALRCQLRGRPFHPWAGRLRFSGEAHPGPATLTQAVISLVGPASKVKADCCCAVLP